MIPLSRVFSASTLNLTFEYNFNNNVKSGDMQIIGSLLYLVTVGVWVNENMDQPTQIGWALIVSICGSIFLRKLTVVNILV